VTVAEGGRGATDYSDTGGVTSATPLSVLLLVRAVVTVTMLTTKLFVRTFVHGRDPGGVQVLTPSCAFTAERGALVVGGV